jgi:NAD(P) transhydrogenase subunit alpha
VTILGPTNLPSDVPAAASEMYANNVAKFVLNMTSKEGKLNINTSDEIVAGTLVILGGELVHERLRQMLQMPPLRPQEATAAN